MDLIPEKWYEDLLRCVERQGDLMNQKEINNMVAGKRVKEARERNNFSQIELARILHYTQANLSMIETGKRSLPREMAQRIAEICGFRVEYLLNLDDYPTEKEYLDSLEAAFDNINSSFIGLLGFTCNEIGISFNLRSSNEVYLTVSNSNDVLLSGEDLETLKQDIIEYLAFKIRQIAATKQNESLLKILTPNRKGNEAPPGFIVTSIHPPKTDSKKETQK